MQTLPGERVRAQEPVLCTCHPDNQNLERADRTYKGSARCASKKVYNEMAEMWI